MKFDKALEIMRRDHQGIRRSNWPKTICLVWIDVNPPDGQGLYLRLNEGFLKYNVTVTDIVSEWIIA